MTELADCYLGNCFTNSSLKTQVEQACRQNACLEVYLDQADCLKGRIYTSATLGEKVGIIKERGWSLTEGDVFTTETGKLLLVHLQNQEIIVLSFTNEARGHVELIHLGHTLGNHHWPILIQDNKIYIQLAADREVIESTIRSFKIPGLAIAYESRSHNHHLSFSHHSHSHHR